MLFTVLLCTAIMGLAFIIDEILSNIVNVMDKNMNANFIGQSHIFLNAESAQQEAFCTEAIPLFTQLTSYLGMFSNLIIVCGIGYFTAVI